MEFDILDLGSSLFIQASDELCHGNTIVALFALVKMCIILKNISLP